MKRTNRALNRVFLAVVGVLLLAAGLSAVVVGAWSPAADFASTAAAKAGEWLAASIEASRIGTSSSWIEVAIAALTLLVIALLLIAVLRTARPRARGSLRSQTVRNELGRVALTETFVADAVKSSLKARADIASFVVKVTDVRGDSVLHVDVSPRRYADPRVLVEAIDQCLRNLRRLTGTEAPVYISVRSGFRARFTGEAQRLN